MKDRGRELRYCLSDLVSQFIDTDTACSRNDVNILITQCLYLVNELLSVLIRYAVTLVADNDLGS